jgi:uncharacterized protein (TIGR03435 family)
MEFCNLSVRLGGRNPGIEVTMSNRIGQILKGPRNFLLARGGVAALVGPLVIGIGHPPAIRAQSRVTTAAAPQQDSAAGSKEKSLTFEAASIKAFSGSGGGGRGGATDVNLPRDISGGVRFPPGRVVSAPGGVTARKMILEAFHLTQYQLSGGPRWLDSDRFALEAKAGGANENQLRQMLQTLLADRFKLVVHRETKVSPVYALVVAKNGPKFKEWKEGDPIPEFGSGGRANNFRDRGIMQRLVDVLSSRPDIGRPVLDETGLKGVYLFYFEWDADEDFLPAMQQQLGLKLEPQRGPVDNLIIDHIDKPEMN